MLTPVQELKIQSKKLLKQSPVSPDLLRLCQNESLQLKHCQRFIARQYGFFDWEHARQVLSCESLNQSNTSAKGYGTFWYRDQCSVLLNHWCRHYEEAKDVLHSEGGYLLPYKKQFVVVKQQYLELLGVDADDPLWSVLGNDWCQGPKEARQALALKRIQKN